MNPLVGFAKKQAFPERFFIVGSDAIRKRERLVRKRELESSLEEFPENMF